jgi:ABC-2 type transport system ATP-binding protein
MIFYYMIKFQEITKSFKSDIFAKSFLALDNVSFQIPSGSMVGFLGANGAGKTTSLKIIMDFIRPSSGRVEFDQELGVTKNDILKNIGFLPERPYFYQNLQGREFLSYLASLSELPSSLVKERISYWAPRFKIDHALNREIKTYSKGMLQRIGFLGTILHDPRLIILDEPLSGLDPIGRKELKDVIIEVHKAGKTVFFSSHIVPDIEEICDRVIFLQQGKLIYDGTVNDLIRQDKSSLYELKVIATQLPLLTTSYQLINEFGDLKVLEVQDHSKRNLIEELYRANIDVVSLEPKKLSLEEIFYKTRG